MKKLEPQKEQTIITIRDKVYILEILDFSDSPIDTEDLLQVQMNNIIADIITFPVIFNRIGNLKSQIDEYLRESQLDCKIFEAQMYEEHKKKLMSGGGKATETSIDASITRDPRYRAKKMDIIKIQKEADIIDSLYWAAKSKDQKLNTISAKLSPEEFSKEILEGTINSVQIRVQKNHFAQGRQK